MNLVLRCWLSDDLNKPPVDLVVCAVPVSLFSSVCALRHFLATHAGRRLGGFEGRDWRIVPEPRGCLVPFHASSTDGSRSLVIE